MRTIDADKLSADMYHEAFVKDSDMQKWDSGCWIRYKMFENVLKAQPTVQPETNCSEIPNNSDTISRHGAIDALKAIQTYKLFAGDDMLLIDQAEAQTELMMLPSAEPEIIRCKDCKYYKYGICMKIGANKSFHGFCDWAERGEQE